MSICFLQPTAVAALERRTLNQSVCLGLTELIASPRLSYMLPGENWDFKIFPTKPTGSLIDRLPRTQHGEGRPHTVRTSADNGHTAAALFPSGYHLGLVIQACASARWQGLPPGTELDYLFPSQRKRSPSCSEIDQQGQQGNGVSKFLTLCTIPWLSLKAGGYASISEPFPWGWIPDLSHFLLPHPLYICICYTKPVLPSSHCE